MTTKNEPATEPDPLPSDLRAAIAREASAFGASRGYSPTCDCKICGPRLADMRDRLERIARLAWEARGRAECHWTVDEDAIWNTECGQTWYFDDAGSPADHKQRFCGYCGRSVVVLPPAPTSDEPAQEPRA